MAGLGEAKSLGRGHGGWGLVAGALRSCGGLGECSLACSFARSFARMDKFSPVFYRTSSPSGTLPKNGRRRWKKGKAEDGSGKGIKNRRRRKKQETAEDGSRGGRKGKVKENKPTDRPNHNQKME